MNLELIKEVLHVHLVVDSCYLFCSTIDTINLKTKDTRQERNLGDLPKSYIQFYGAYMYIKNVYYDSDKKTIL